MKRRSSGSLLLLIVSLAFMPSAGAVGEKKAEPARSVEKTAVKHTLERADLQFVGSSCASCLMRVEAKLNKAPGVVKAAVSIFHPYPAIIIYDPSKTSLAKIKTAIVGEPARFDKVVERPIDKVPDVLMPATGKLEGQPAH